MRSEALVETFKAAWEREVSVSGSLTTVILLITYTSRRLKCTHMSSHRG